MLTDEERGRCDEEFDAVRLERVPIGGVIQIRRRHQQVGELRAPAKLCAGGRMIVEVMCYEEIVT